MLLIVYNDIMGKLLEAGYSSYTIQKNGILPSSTLTRLRNNLPISTDTLNTICELCKCQPGQLLTWTPDKHPEE
jgi:DNA-binding Xre family transcriptional regulator